MANKRLNIFIDETGDFGFSEKSSELYGISFVFHDSSDNITEEVKYLNNNLADINYHSMIHMADLVAKRGDYEKFSLEKRHKIFWNIFYFTKRIPIKIKSIFINKRYQTQSSQLIRELEENVDSLINNYKKKIQKYDLVVVYYDEGQERLAYIIKKAFAQFNNVEHRKKFNLKDKKLFQVADMLTCIDKLEFKTRNKIPLTKNEKYFISYDSFKKLQISLKNKRAK